MYQEEEQVRLRRQSSKQAIALAMEGRWREAVAVNKGIVDSFPNDVDAYNRLGRAYMELGEYSLAGEAYRRAQELDPYNAIAEKNLRRLSHLREVVAGLGGSSHRVEPQVFIEETGKAGVVNLYHLVAKEVLAEIDAGDKVNLRIVGTNLVVENGRGRYLGQVEPRHSQRLIKLIKGGNQYTATVISSSEDKLAVIIREVYQHPSQVGQLSFPGKGFAGLRPYLGGRVAGREPEYNMGDEEEPELLAAESAEAASQGEDEDEEGSEV